MFLKSHKNQAFFFLIILISSVLGFGYYSSLTQGYYYLTLTSPTQTLINAKVQFLDINHKILAEGQSDNTHGIVHAKHPEIGYCYQMEKQAAFSSKANEEWKACFNKLSHWIIDWAPNVRFLNISANNCSVINLPVNIRSYKDDWWLWWVPLPHIGGRPMTTFHFDISLANQSGCP